MTVGDAGWQVERDVDDGAAAEVLMQERIWTAYMLGDLEPPFRAYTTVALARRAGEPPSAAYLILRHPDFTATVTHGDATGLAAIMDAVELPERTFVSTRQEHRPVLERAYTFADERMMRRMHVTAETFAQPESLPSAAVRLGPPDLTALLDLYAHYTESAFVPDHLTGGVFYGVHDDGGLIAAGGTHIVSAARGIAVVGNIFTRPEARGHGYGTAITAAVVADLLAMGCRDVVLNVAVTNVSAAAIYERLGFRDYCRFWEAQATAVTPPLH